MKHGIDPAKLTAYALGELSGAEAREIEALAKTDPDIRRFIDETRAMARELKSDLNEEPTPPKSRGTFLGFRRFSNKYAEAGAGLLILLLLAIPASRRVSKFLHGSHGLENAPQQADIASEGSLNAEAIGFLDSLAKRPTVEAAVRDCRFEVPQLLRQDTKGEIVDSVLEGLQGKNLQLNYHSSTGSELYNLAVLLGSVAGSAYKKDPKDIVKSEGDFQFVTHHTDTQSSVVFGFAGTAAAAYCWVSVTLEGQLKGSALSDISSKIQDLAERVALSLAAKKAPGSNP
ncbi:MAG: anti-sigma factor family protein [Bdellovibrionota bacterium]